MIIRCRRCHKKFDNDKYFGMCPKCGTYNSSKKEEQPIIFLNPNNDEQEDYMDQEYDDIEREREEGMETFPKRSQMFETPNGQEFKKEVAGKKKGRRINKVLFWLMLLVLVFTYYLEKGGAFKIATLNPFHKIQKDIDPEGVKHKVSNIPEEIHNPKEEFRFGSNSGEENLSIRIENAKVLAKPGAFKTFPEGKQCVGVFAELASFGDEGPAIGNIYIKSGDVYKEVIDSYYFEPYAEFYGIKQLSDRISNDSYEEGYLIFFVGGEDKEVTFYIEELENYHSDKVIARHKVIIPLEKEENNE